MSFGETLKDFICPNLTWKSFIAIISVVDIVCFVLMFVWSLMESGMLSTSQFLGPSIITIQHVTKDPIKIVNDYQIYRLFLPIFVHTGFGHLVMNLATQLMFGSWLESMVGFTHTAVLYLATCYITVTQLILQLISSDWRIYILQIINDNSRRKYISF